MFIQSKSKWGVDSILVLRLLGTYTYICLMFCLLSYSLYFLIFSIPSQDILYKKNDEEDAIHVSIHFFFFLGYGDRIFPQKCELWVELSLKAMRTRIQDPLQFFLLMGHSWSLKVTYFRVFKEVLYVRKIKYIFYKKVASFFLLLMNHFFPLCNCYHEKGETAFFLFPC